MIAGERYVSHVERKSEKSCHPKSHRGILRAMTVMLALFLLVFPSNAPTVSSSTLREASSGHHPILPLRGSQLQTTSPSTPNYDEQIGLTFTDTFSSLAYNVTAISQQNSDGYGPAYLLNGLTDRGYWYQVGLSWNWNPGSSPGAGFSMNYEVWDTNGYSIFPTDGGGGLASLSGVVDNGDNVRLSLNFTGVTVVMYVADLNTGAAASVRFSSEGASSFVGLINPSNTNGYFSGLMTEEYYNSPYFGNVQAVNYTSSTPLSNGFLWVDEFTVSPRSTLFYGQKFVSFADPVLVQTFARNGTTSYADAWSFITGALNEQILTLSYSVVGAGTGYAAPVLTYVLNGVQRLVNLTETTTTFFADTGSTWQASLTLPGSTASERWRTARQSGGVLSSSVDEQLVYYHQYRCYFGFNVVGGGQGYAPPVVDLTMFGTTGVSTAGQFLWVDAGSSYSYASSLIGSTPSERWSGRTMLPASIGPGNFTWDYFHQYSLTLGLNVTGGGSPTVTITAVEFGQTVVSALNSSQTHYVDAGTVWTVPSTVAGSTSQERWITAQSTNGTLSAPSSILFIYKHQYTLKVYASPTNAGTVTQPDLWQNNGSTVRLSVNASSGWRFWYWFGVNTGPTTNETTIQVGGPVVAIAVFIPGLQIIAGSNGAVTYAFGSETGIVAAGTSKTVFAGQGTTFLLHASPSSFLYAFSGWSGNVTGNNGTTTVLVETPKSVSASFVLNLPAVGGITAVVMIAVGVAALALLRRGRPRQST